MQIKAENEAAVKRRGASIAQRGFSPKAPSPEALSPQAPSPEAPKVCFGAF